MADPTANRTAFSLTIPRNLQPRISKNIEHLSILIIPKGEAAPDVLLRIGGTVRQDILFRAEVSPADIGIETITQVSIPDLNNPNVREFFELRPGQTGRLNPIPPIDQP